MIGAQGYASRSRTGTRREVGGDDPRLSASSSTRSPPSSGATGSRSARVSARTRARRCRASRRGPHLRVLGARGVSLPGRGVAAVPPPDARPPPVARRRHRGASRAGGGGSRSDPRARPARVARLRRQGGGGMWNWKPAKLVLEALWNSGEIVIAGRVSGFQRLYDLAERVIPSDVLDAPVPDAETRDRELALRAIRARGALTEAGIVEHWRIRGGVARIRPPADALVAEGPRAPPGRGRGRRRSRPRRHGPRPAAADGRRAPLPLRQPPLGSPVRAACPRLRPPDRGLQARAPSASSATTSCRCSGAIASSGGPTSSPSAPTERSW